jgi:hypothetical protein
MKAAIKELFGIHVQNRKVYVFKPGFRTTKPNTALSFEKWCQEFRVSMMHGKEVKHFG